MLSAAPVPLEPHNRMHPIPLPDFGRCLSISHMSLSAFRRLACAQRARSAGTLLHTGRDRPACDLSAQGPTVGVHVPSWSWSPWGTGLRSAPLSACLASPSLLPSLPPLVFCASSKPFASSSLAVGSTLRKMENFLSMSNRCYESR